MDKNPVYRLMSRACRPASSHVERATWSIRRKDNAKLYQDTRLERKSMLATAASPDLCRTAIDSLLF
jgi:hypothetical protein